MISSDRGPLATPRDSEEPEFQSYLVEIYSAKYFCPQYEQEAAIDLRAGIIG